MKFAIRPILMATAAAAGQAADTTGSAPSTNVAGAEAEQKKRAPKNPDNKLNIINGRLPLPLVYLLRFKEKTGTTAEKAKKYGTSVGKVFDIEKNRNFGYLVEAYKPSAEEVAQANKWLTEMKTAKGQTLKESGGDPDGIKTQLDALGVATADEVAARGWQTRVVGQKADAGTAPVAGSETKAAATGAAAAPAGATKLF